MNRNPSDGFKLTIFADLEKLDSRLDNLDVQVELENGKRYVATFFTLENIRRIMQHYQHTGECNFGQYFWASDMIIVKEITLEEIKKTVRHLIEIDELDEAFLAIEDD
jgi:hypothetical protein